MKIKDLLLIISFLFIISCGEDTFYGHLDDGKDKEDVPTNSKAYKSLIKDSLYLTGFTYGNIPEGTPGIVGYLDYNGKAKGSTPYWHIGQWNNWNNDLREAFFTDEDPLFKYETSGGNGIIIDTHKGSIIMRHNTESEYGHSPQLPDNPNSGQRWPHLLLSRDFVNDELIQLSSQKEILMSADFTITQFENKIPLGLEKSGHTAQLNQYIGLSNRTPGVGFGEFFWFGLTYFDRRFDFPGYFASEDFGTFIYIPDMREILTRKTEIGKKQKVEVDILPRLKTAFKLAKERGYIPNTKWEDLRIGSMNFGWEITGTYNVSVTIDEYNIKYK